MKRWFVYFVAGLSIFDVLIAMSASADASASATLAFNFAPQGSPPPPPPPPTLSADGTIVQAPNGQLLTSAGAWTWGVTVSGRPNEYRVNLNGNWVGTGSVMEVANGGQLYVNTLNSGWYLWTSGGFVSNAGPGGVVPPPPPPPVVSTSVTCTVAYAAGQNSFQLPATDGTKIATCSVAPNNWVGSLSLSGADASFFTVSGTNILAKGIVDARTYTAKITSSP